MSEPSINMASIIFLNLDLDLESKHDLTPLLKEIDNSVVVMNQEQGEINKLSFELAGITGNPDELVFEYGRLIKNLTKHSKNLWESCSKRELDFGFECEGDTSGIPIGLTERLSIESIQLLSKLNITVAVTIYFVPS